MKKRLNYFILFFKAIGNQTIVTATPYYTTTTTQSSVVFTAESQSRPNASLDTTAIVIVSVLGAIAFILLLLILGNFND